MVKLFPWEMVLNVDGQMKRIELSLHVDDMSRRPYEAILKLRGLDKDIEHINIEMPLGNNPQVVDNVNPDFLSETSKKNSKSIVDLFREVVRRASNQLDESSDKKEMVCLTALRNIAKIKDDPEYTKERIISYVEKIIEKQNGG